MKKIKLPIMRRMLAVVAGMIVTFQVSSQQISYKILEDQPESKNLFIGLNVFDAIAYYPNMTIGYQVYGNYLMGKRFQIDADFRSSYLDDHAQGVFAPKDLTKAWSFSAGGAFNFSHYLKKGKARIILSSSTVGRTTYTKYIMVPAMFRKIWAVRGGVQQFHQNCAADVDLTSFPQKSDIQYKDANGNLTYLIDQVNFETPTYTMNSFCFYAGLDFKSIVDIKVKPEGYHEKRRAIKFNMYADLILSPSVTYTLMPNEKQTQFKGIDIDIPENKRNHFGWRIGWKQDMGKYAGFSFKTEVGQMPGNSDKPWFVSVGGGLHIGAKLGK